MYSSFPNPFATEASTSYNSAPPANITLLDESEMHQSLLLWSQIQPARHSEFIIVWKNSVEALPYSWNNGTNLYSSYIYAIEAGIPFPIVPEAMTFINRNYTTKPVFSGCDANLTTTNDTRAPIILYLANSPYSSFTNYSGFTETVSYENIQAIMTNSANMVTQGNSTLDSDWPECLGCAAIDRSLAKVGMERTVQCQQCMSRWCWDGTADNTPTGWVDLSLVLDPSSSFAEWNKTSPYWAGNLALDNLGADLDALDNLARDNFGRLIH